VNPADPVMEVRKQVAARLRELETALIAHGLIVQVEAKFWRLEVRAPASVHAPARTQVVQLAPEPSGNLELSWFLVVPGEVDGITATEPIGAEADIAGAVEHIAQALRQAGQ
jgi:hypothetical protein